MKVMEQLVRGSTLALEPRADVIRSPKQRYEWPHQHYFLKIKCVDDFAVFLLTSFLDNNQLQRKP